MQWERISHPRMAKNPSLARCDSKTPNSEGGWSVDRINEKNAGVILVKALPVFRAAVLEDSS